MPRKETGSVIGLMGIPDGREAVRQEDLREPRCPLPRPGESVTWYEDMLRQNGELLGSTEDGRPYIRRDDGETGPVDSFDAIRAADPENPISGPIWRSLLPGLICRPSMRELESLERLAAREVPPGVSHRDLAHEIWLHGFEVFFTGSAVREALTGREYGSAELVTTMPADRLRRIIISMYGGARTDVDQDDSGQDGSAGAGAAAQIYAGRLAQLTGRITFGGLPGSADPYAEARPFRYAKRSRSNSIARASFIFGADFQHDMDFGDFSVNAIYYDPENRVVVDPSGHGLDDIAAHCLCPVLKAALLTPCEQAYVGLRIVRHYLQHDTFCDDHRAELLELVRRITSMRHVDLASALDAELFSCFQGQRTEVMDEARSFFERFGMKEIWRKHIQPCL